MRCPMESPERSERLVAFSARQLDPHEAAVLEQHVRGCAACGEFLAAQRAVWEALELWEAPAVSVDFDRRLYRRIEQEVSWWDFLVRPFRPGFAARLLPVAAAAGLLIAAGVWIEQPNGSPLPPARSAQIEALPPEQGEHVLQEMQMMQDFSRLVHSDTADPRM